MKLKKPIFTITPFEQIVIYRTKNKQFAMRHRGLNYEKLSATETLTTRANVIKNIRAHMAIYGCTSIWALDLTGKKPKTIEVKI